ncbi:UDP-N-acetylmuramate:L-alanyl-gamma-D-glutamyl-meso-diaminopimelate ligase [Thiorhodovibrio frisius]|uniref:UDP-N-acetylmuramate--L-alanyl-gamma-D-glutamyl-meso-2,6-diaminoheptandioate ligase n=1 Tax=Thiorhodovibrio frisius TaxID=631362 RepID=H8Z5I2_9GAMM|nr:UDP-N-acetylmuramate:L-alanyl-gamma-D-glutamyl-meso-diaminopimelate ligase [Thiorhodovibrio frisius]EIC20552.1 UDP-N-acetylmuramate:L-alanyl-gamma-D-glutamyl-meso-diaminopimelate ligase [Thiorhodovibrio frisius]WPL21300.1 UDP-N-acetylmuramate:L-alanyl-gamma-D-glutamyl-meso-diaminopimelate ligase [Thiorhodovibrio frisius]
MHLHILGICGTFMGGLALLARELGHRVTGSDANVYPPMSTQLEAAGIELSQGYAASHLQPAPDVVVVGNAMTRGVPAVEYMLDQGLPYVSGPQWLAEHLLGARHVLAVAGTHGKTTTASLLAWLLEDAGLEPGFLIGGVPGNFGLSARLGAGRYFVVEADEYDTAFFDKRSKFLHYRPRTLVINNLEFDHADIFDDLAAIQRQFHHLVRTVPGSGLIIHPQGVESIEQVLAMGCWTQRQSLALVEPEPTDAPAHPSTQPEADWRAELLNPAGAEVRLHRDGAVLGAWSWNQTGRHNVSNALAAIAAAAHVGVEPQAAMATLERFQGVRRRMELRGEVGGVRLYDDFAHHPTAIATTLDGLRKSVGQARILAVLEPRSNTMRAGVHAKTLAASLGEADLVYLFAPADLGWDAAAVMAPLGERVRVHEAIEPLVAEIIKTVQPGDHLLVMSNGGFQGIHQRLLDALQSCP